MHQGFHGEEKEGKWNRDAANPNEQSIFTNQKENRASSSNEEGGNGVFRLYGAVHTYEEHTSADVQFYDVEYKKKNKKKRKKKKRKGRPIG